MARLSSLASVADTRAVLDRFGLSTKKSLGQHFLINDGVVERICNLAELSHTDRVVEVGPGIGTLTEALLKRSGATSMVSASLVRRCKAILLNTALASSPISCRVVMKERSVYSSLVFSL